MQWLISTIFLAGSSDFPDVQTITDIIQSLAKMKIDHLDQNNVKSSSVFFSISSEVIDMGNALFLFRDKTTS